LVLNVLPIACSAFFGCVSLTQDLLTDEPFVKKDDVIIIQDPAQPNLRDVNQFHFVKNNERLEVL
jgi:hypothetical protein